MRILVRLVWAFVFFSLFAFSLNNQQSVSLNWFFGHAWTAPLVMIVLLSFASGIVVGVLAMTPSWWRHRRLARQQQPVPETPRPPASAPAVPTPLNDTTDPQAHGI